jgi:hypothetical protein
LSVYSEWQNLRTIWSSKIKSDCQLLPVDLQGNSLEVQDPLLYFIAYVAPKAPILDVFNLNINLANLPKTEISKQIKSHVKRADDL